MVIIKLLTLGNKLQEKTEMRKTKQSKTENDPLNKQCLGFKSQ